MNSLPPEISKVASKRWNLWEQIDDIRIPVISVLERVRQGIETILHFIEDFDLDEFINGVELMSKKDFWEEINELTRRQIVVLEKALGTEIREEALKRQALSAWMNLDKAKDVQHSLKDWMERSFPLDEISAKFSEMVRSSPPPPERVAFVIGDLLKETVWRFIGLAFTTGFHKETILSILHDLNALIEQVVNPIKAELRSEGIFCSDTSPVPISVSDQVEVMKFPLAYLKATEVVMFLETVKRAGEKRGLIAS